jgi:hypothetical protein
MSISPCASVLSGLEVDANEKPDGEITAAPITVAPTSKVSRRVRFKETGAMFASILLAICLDDDVALQLAGGLLPNVSQKTGLMADENHGGIGRR